jgi:hypothetical protein
MKHPALIGGKHLTDAWQKFEKLIRQQAVDRTNE